MDASEILERLKELVDGWVGLGIHPTTHKYKRQLVPLFREAWEQGFTGSNSSPRLTEDAMADTIAERWPEWLEQSENRATFSEMAGIWDEWTFIKEEY
ncbi:MAG: hypothetical protein KJ970_18560 [Candidatus Eisenbacteria bacterium]|uniref:Uncharacterized protein n=1 Tax=Eiseniibacteriota bacterium TaxID=2212470 RepID=A0A948RY07_UNCEI|nr:hypothetical protein [Candidatus Eisenbacteria bacterium]MBU1949305.1 hypothetical protein [Candidatus Eisenbacteria bacterium]MBU2692925.1 hypothetical protein [Candidatus Eisenbacteria bacterium]